MKYRNSKANQGQSILEYTIILGTVIIIFFTMTPYVKRNLEGFIKLAADQIGNQVNAEQSFDESGHLESQYVTSRATRSKVTEDVAGITTIKFDDDVITGSNVLINLGVSPQPPL